jgi:N-acyl-D-aspartate/D-glutamate deacylase
MHPFITHPTMKAMAHLPLADQVARLRRPEVRAQLLSEEPTVTNIIYRTLMSRWEQIFPLGDPPGYEPTAAESIAGLAERDGRDEKEVALDLLLEQDGAAFLFAPLANYVDLDHDAMREMMTHEATVVGLSDGGAHCGLICDVSFPTYLLTHWVRDRDRGERLDLEDAVRFQSADTADAYGLTDRGRITVGRRADLNLIDLDALSLEAPEMIFDLPGGGRRLIQRATGYVMTIQHGEITFENGRATGARPGRLVRA